MSEQKLRDLLAEAREATGGACASACTHENCVLRRRIDAALAEPVEPPAESLRVAKMVAARLQRERDEARAEVEKLREAVNAWARTAAWSYQRGAEAMREAAAKVAGDAATLAYESECSGLAESIEEQIRALPVPEDKP